mmetsp:Transcript_23864/g.34155  ORF Transcript_23864/g.34155 Transcript_23864/m.34155 type:complete len:93 (+) Transcript_23864:353-631(+)
MYEYVAASKLGRYGDLDDKVIQMGSRLYLFEQTGFDRMVDDHEVNGLFRYTAESPPHTLLVFLVTVWENAVMELMVVVDTTRDAMLFQNPDA